MYWHSTYSLVPASHVLAQYILRVCTVPIHEMLVPVKTQRVCTVPIHEMLVPVKTQSDPLITFALVNLAMFASIICCKLYCKQVGSRSGPQNVGPNLVQKY